MAELGIKLSDDDVAHMMSLADTDGDGRINYEGRFALLSVGVSCSEYVGVTTYTFDGLCG